MYFNLDEYIKLKTIEIEYFLRNINFSNIGKRNSKIVEYPLSECSSFFNEVGPNRFITEEFLLRIKEYYSHLINIDLEFASSKEEVDTAIKVFVDKIRRELDEYKYTLIKQNFISKDKIRDKYISINNHNDYKVKEDNLISLGLNFIKIQIGDKVFSIPKTGREAEKDEVVLDNLNIMLVYVYCLIGMINDKKNKKEELIDFNAVKFKVNDPRYLEIYNEVITSYLTIKIYNDFIAKCDDLFEQIKTGKTKQTMINELSKIMENYNGISEDILPLIGSINHENDYIKIKTIYYEMKKSSPELFDDESKIEDVHDKPKARH